MAAVQKAALEAVTAAQAQRCIRCTDGCSPEHPRAASPDAPAPAADPGTASCAPLPSAAASDADGIISASLRKRVRAMGEQFLLSDREVDVLTLYALGHTQKKVAEALYITPATAHSHIKRIYSKCGLHSRQEILEYLTTWGS